MPDDLLAHYNQELLSIRRAAAAFAAEHPRIAGRLRLSDDVIEDPHVSRLIESFAYLTARVRQKLDDDFPVMTDALLGILYPHYQRPVPSMAIVQLEPQPSLVRAPVIPSGTMLDTEEVEGESCRFRTAYPVKLHPLSVRAAALGGQPISAPSVARAAGASSCLRITLETLAPEATFAALAPDTVRFFLRGAPPLVYPLYELLLNDAIAVAFATGVDDPAPIVMDPQALTPVGFGSDEGLLPYPPTSHAGFRLITEYLSFPEKFLFVDLRFPDKPQLARMRRTLDVFIYLRRAMPSLEQAVSADAFKVGCTPVVNLFPQAAEPIALDHVGSDYRVTPDSRRPRAIETYSIERVSVSDGSGGVRQLLPFYEIKHAADPANRNAGARPPTWWIAHRETAPSDNPGSEVYLSIFDPEFDPTGPANQVLSVDTLCFNRNLPERLPFGGGHPMMQAVDPLPSVVRVRALTAPTASARPSLGRGAQWRLVSHLALNHLSLTAPDANPLREILLLYDFRDSAETRSLIDGIVGMAARPGAARVRESSAGHGVLCRGLDVTITFDEAKFSGNGVFLMASVLERFLGLYASVNSFTRLTASIKGRTGALKTWPARAGDRILL
jgi:type VI secretion system protein ImpG